MSNQAQTTEQQQQPQTIGFWAALYAVFEAAFTTATMFNRAVKTCDNYVRVAEAHSEATVAKYETTFQAEYNELVQDLESKGKLKAA